MNHIEANVLHFHKDCTITYDLPDIPVQHSECLLVHKPATGTVTSSKFCAHMRRLSTRSDVALYMNRHTVANPQFGPPPFVLLHTLFPLPQCTLFGQLGHFPVEIQPQIPVSEVELPLCCCDEGSPCETHVGDFSCGCFRLLSKLFQSVAFGAICPLQSTLMGRLFDSVGSIPFVQTGIDTFLVKMTDTLHLIQNVLSWHVDPAASTSCINEAQYHTKWVPMVLEAMFQSCGAHQKQDMTDILRRIFVTTDLQPKQPFLPVIFSILQQNSVTTRHEILASFFNDTRSVRAFGGKMEAVFSLCRSYAKARRHLPQQCALLLCSIEDVDQSLVETATANRPCVVIVWRCCDDVEYPSTECLPLVPCLSICIESVGQFLAYKYE